MDPPTALLVGDKNYSQGIKITMKTNREHLIKRDAVISMDNRHRYMLARDWDDSLPRCAFIMINPSTADAEQDDPTIRKCIGFAKRLGYGGCDVVNLFSLRTPDVKELKKASANGDPITKQLNDEYIQNVAKAATKTFAAWGSISKIPKEPQHRFRDQEVVRYLGIRGIELWCIGRTKDGDPRHPLMTSYSTEPTRFTNITDPKPASEK